MENTAFTQEQVKYLDNMFNPERIAKKVKARLADRLAQNDEEAYLLQLYRVIDDDAKERVKAEIERGYNRRFCPDMV